VTEGSSIDAAGVNHGFVRAADRTITAFDVQGAGTVSGQGTIAANINTPGMIEGYFIDASGVFQGFLRSKQGVISTYDVPGAGTGSFQGTRAGISNPRGGDDGILSRRKQRGSRLPAGPVSGLPLRLGPAGSWDQRASELLRWRFRESDRAAEPPGGR
jgi:hypothetical protein